MKARGGPLVALLFAALLVVPCTGVADERGLFQGKVAPVVVSPSTEPDTYGVAQLTVLMMGSYQFHEYYDLGVGSLNPASNLGRFITSASQAAIAHPVLPNGARVEYIELRACDSSATDEVVARLYNCEAPCSEIASVTTGTTATPGCGNFLYQLPAPLVVNNQNLLAVTLRTGPTSTTAFSGVKLYYRLQVSPAPGVASFTDVPTDYWAFQYIEALKASGITQGVTPTTFEPESNVTRAQMAVFLAKALGLHWPN